MGPKQSRNTLMLKVRLRLSVGLKDKTIGDGIPISTERIKFVY